AGPGRGLAVGDLVEAAVRAVDLIEIVAFTGIGPVGDEDAAVGAVVQGDAAEPGVISKEEIAAVVGDVAGATAFEDVLVDAVAVDIAHKNVVAVGVRPVVAEVNHAAA